MEQIVQLHIEKLPEGVYLATSDDMPGLVAQGRTIQETLEIARDVAKKLLEARAEHSGTKRVARVKLAPVKARFDYPLIVSAQRASGIWFNPATRRYTTIPNHPGDMPEGTLRAILKQADITPEAFLSKR